MSNCKDDEECQNPDIVAALPTARPDNLAARWEKILASGEWSDCSFRVGLEDPGVKSFECHKIVLASCSPVFGAMLLGPMAENKFPIIIPDITPTAFHGILMYAYTGKLTKMDGQSELIEICVAADKYQVEGLLDACANWLCENLNPNNLPSMLDLANQYNIQKLKEFCIRLLQDSTGDILSSPAFTTSSVDVVNLLVRQDQLNVKEDQVADAVMKWATALMDQQTESNSETKAEIEPSVSNIQLNNNEDNQIIKKRHGISLRSTTSNKRHCLQYDKGYSKKPNKKSKKEFLGIRKELGSVFQHIRFLSTSLDFNAFVKKYPGLLTQHEVSAIKKCRLAYKNANIPFCALHHRQDPDCYMCNKNTEAEDKFAKQQNSNPLPNSLCNEVSNRLSPQYFTYKNDNGKEVNFKFCPLKILDRVENISPNMVDSFYFCPNRTIMLHGVRLSSQIAPNNNYDHSTYEEHILFDIKARQDNYSEEDVGEDEVEENNIEDIDHDYKHLDKGKIEFKEVVSFNSIIDIIFPTPLKIDANKKYQMDIAFCVKGKYLKFNTKENDSNVGLTKINFNFFSSHNYIDNVLQGLIFDVRDQKYRGNPKYCNIKERDESSSYYSWSPFNNPYDDYDISDFDDSDVDDSDVDDEDE